MQHTKSRTPVIEANASQSRKRNRSIPMSDVLLESLRTEDSRTRSGVFWARVTLLDSASSEHAISIRKDVFTATYSTVYGGSGLWDSVRKSISLLGFMCAHITSGGRYRQNVTSIVVCGIEERCATEMVTYFLPHSKPELKQRFSPDFVEPMGHKRFRRDTIVKDTLFNSILQQLEARESPQGTTQDTTGVCQECYLIDAILNKMTLHFPMTQSSINNTAILIASERYTVEEFNYKMLLEGEAQRWKPYTSLSHVNKFLMRFGPFNSGAIARIEQFARHAKAWYHGSLDYASAISRLAKEHERDPQRTHYLVIDAPELKSENRTSLYSLLFWPSDEDAPQRRNLWQCALSGCILVQESRQKVCSYDSVASAIRWRFPKHDGKSHAIACWHYDDLQTGREDIIITEGLVLPDID